MLKILQKVFSFLLILGIGIWTKTNWVKHWSNIYHWIWNRSKTTEVTVYASSDYVTGKLAKFLSTAKYSSDGIKELFDVFPFPAVTEFKYRSGVPIGDCGSFAYYAAFAAQGFSNTQKTAIMTVFWFVKPGSIKSNAHNVALLYSGNAINFMDYGAPVLTGTKDLNEVALLVAKQFDSNPTVISWSIRDLDLNVIQSST